MRTLPSGGLAGILRGSTAGPERVDIAKPIKREVLPTN